jgi:hypothetical protein
MKDGYDRENNLSFSLSHTHILLFYLGHRLKEPASR